MTPEDLELLLDRYPVQHFRDQLTSRLATVEVLELQRERLARETAQARRELRRLPQSAPLPPHRQARYDDL